MNPQVRHARACEVEGTWNLTSPATVLYAYLLECHRRGSSRSVPLGSEFHAAHGTAPSSGRYETLCLLVRGVSVEAQLCWAYRWFGYRAGGQWEVKSELLESGKELLISQQTAAMLGDEEVGENMRRRGFVRRHAKVRAWVWAQRHEALLIVAYNLAQWRAR